MWASTQWLAVCWCIHCMAIPVSTIDVTVIGGGLAGMAASIHLSKAGLRVLCVEPEVADTEVRWASRWIGPRLVCSML